MNEQNQIINEDAKTAVKKVKSFLTKYETYEIATQEQYESAAEDLKHVKSKYNELDKLRKTMTKPLDESKRAIMAFFKEPLDKLKGAETIIKRGVINYDEEMERQRQKEEEKAKRKLERQAEKAEKKGDVERADELREDAENLPIEQSYEKAQGISIKDNWVAEVVDFKLLVQAVAQGKAPIVFLMENQVMLNKQAKATKDSITYPGVKFVNKKITAVRT